MIQFGRRRGSVTIWTLLCMPLLITLLCVVAEVGYLWQSRMHLENALDAAALATVKEWGDRGGGPRNIAPAQTVGRAYAWANTVHGMAVDLDNSRIAPRVQWAFGTATANGTGFDFAPAVESTANMAVVVHARVRVAPLFKSVFGPAMDDTLVTATAAAFYDTSAQPPRARLIRLSRPWMGPVDPSQGTSLAGTGDHLGGTP